MEKDHLEEEEAKVKNIKSLQAPKIEIKLTQNLKSM